MNRYEKNKILRREAYEREHPRHYHKNSIWAIFHDEQERKIKPYIPKKTWLRPNG